ncbi:MAG: glycogen debranching enzyme GlgX, partial [Rhodospirillales bacterium]|nr:glycogen debranching enzyme GlgX [Rhodospirillales bacterium]
DLFDRNGRRPWATVNFVNAHDGFTLADLVAYNHKHNDANKEDSRDGTDNNNSWNCGVEGPTDDPEVLRLRLKQRRNLFATLFLSQGLPMFVAGDEFGRTQNGNNNAYCQDSEISWMDWSGISDEDKRFLEFARQIIRLRRDHIVFSRAHFFHARYIPGTEINDIAWCLPDGTHMRDEDWADPNLQALGFVIRGEAGEYHLTPTGEPQPDDSFLLILNAHHGSVTWTLPTIDVGACWQRLLDTDEDDLVMEGPMYKDLDTYEVKPRSMVLMIRCDGETAMQDQ